VQVLLGHFGLEDGILLSIHALSLKNIPGFKSLLAGAELGKSDYLFPGRLRDGGGRKMRVLCGPRRRYAIASVLGETGKVVLIAETLRITTTANTGSWGALYEVDSLFGIFRVAASKPEENVNMFWNSRSYGDFSEGWQRG
jgi:hypothetical protein